MMKNLSLWVLTLCTMTLMAGAQAPAKKPGEAVSLKGVSFKGEIKPGAAITAVLQFQIQDGFHVQANPASEDTYVPAVLKLDPAVGVVSSPAKYPAGKEEKVTGLDKPLKVYEKTFEILVPMKLDTTASLPLSLTGTLSYQACKGSTCFPPRRLKVDLKLP